MTSYFEIGGHIVECHEILTSPELKSFVAEVTPVISDVSDAYKSAAPSSRSGGKEKDSLFTHWVKTSSLPARKMGGDILWMNPWTNPRGFAAKGIGILLQVPGMHYDYFVKGESHDW